MYSDYTVWDIDGVLEAYREVPEWRESVEIGYKSLFLFMERNGLVNCKVSNELGEVVKRSIKASEITEEGRLLTRGPKNPVGKWMRSKGGQKNPPDMKILEKALAEIRASKAAEKKS